ncbi:MAG TPA: fenitrothion hydrolase [Solirubrobacteraceae bacterium]|nr:fenitrothion hydrolase [Solirubrobacteraceae bacterium]
MLAVPATASAHGLVQRSNLPIPEWLFGWAAAIVLVISFVALAALWPTPRMEGTPSWKPLAGGAVLGSRPVEVLCGAIGVGLLVVVMLAGYIGSGVALDNLAPTFILITFWVGLVFASAIFGNVFKAFSPWRALGRLLPSGGLRPYPEQLGRWPAAVGLLIFTWIELASGWGEDPALLVTAALGYTILTLIAQVVWGVETWSRNGETFAVYFGLFSRISPFQTRDRVVGVRPPLTGLPHLDPVPGTVALLAVMIGTVTFDGLSQGRLWKDLAVDLTDVVTSLGISITEAPRVVSTIGLLAGVALVALFYRAGIAGAHSVGGGISAERLRRAFVHSLVPIALVYVVAHYLTFLLFEGQAIRYLASDPFGQGWDIFGTASAAIDYSLLSQDGAWYAQVGFVVLGHVAALILAHDRALVLYDNARLAVRSQYWMLAIMVGFTTLALWLLAQAGT